MDADERDHVVVVLDGREVEEDGNVLDGLAGVAGAPDLRADRRLEDRDGGLLAEDRPRLLPSLLDVVRFDVGAFAGRLLIDLVEEPSDEVRAFDPDERVDRLSGDGGVRRARHEQRRSRLRVAVPGDPRRRRHLRVHARDVELPIDGVRLRLLAGVAVRVRAFGDLCGVRLELVAPGLAGTPGDRDGSRRRERREQPTSVHVFS